MSTDYQTYSCTPPMTSQSFAGQYTHPQYIPMRIAYAPMTPNAYPSPHPMFISHSYSPVNFVSQPTPSPIMPLQACSPTQFTAMPAYLGGAPLPMPPSFPNGEVSPTLQSMVLPSPSPPLHPSPSSMVGMEGLGYSMGNLSIRVPSPSPSQPGVQYVVAPQMMTPSSSSMMTPSPTQFIVPQNSPVGPMMAPAVPQGPDMHFMKPRPNRTRSRSPGRSVSRESESSESPTAPIPKTEVAVQPAAEPSKRDLVNKAFAVLTQMFGDRFDQDGNRGENIVRLKVKTRNALEHIVPFVERCQQENLIATVSCPISTKKGRQQVRGFLAYLETRTAADADRLEELVRIYNAENKSVFNTWHRNPVSTWKTAQSS